jgi:hypothetical protein
MLNDQIGQNSKSEMVVEKLETTRIQFIEIAENISEEELKRISKNIGWTNNEILAHILFGFIITNVLLPGVIIFGNLPKVLTQPFAMLLNSLTKPFNFINKLGARAQGKVFTEKRLVYLIDKTIKSIENRVKHIKNEDWQKGMYYPNKWDSNFDEFMTLEKLMNYPKNHFEFHKTQLLLNNVVK